MIKNKNLTKFYNFAHLIFVLIGAFIFTILAVSDFFSETYSGSNAERIVFLTVFFLMFLVEHITYIRNMKQVVDIFVLIQRSSSVIKKRRL